MRITSAGKVAVFLIVCGAGYGAFKMWGGGIMSKLAPDASSGVGANVPRVGDVGSGPDGNSDTSIHVSMPDVGAGCTDKPEIRWMHWAWNANSGAMFAVGGKQSTRGSIMCEHGVNMKLTRQDDAGKMQEALVSFATDLSRGNSNPSSGTHFVTIMGDGAAAFLAGVNPTLRKLGPEYQAKIVGVIGYSHGEDKFMGLPEWRQNPQSSKGGVVAGYLRDGDWNIAIKWLSDNGIKNNPDEKTWDPDALNWVAANDYIDAAEKYVAGYSEERPVVRNGKRTGETKRIYVNGVVTWTPGDVTVAEKKGGLVSIVSTKEYSSQMPCVVIGIDKWMRNNRGLVENMLQGMLEGGAAVKSSDAALRKAMEINTETFGEQSPEYWMKYYKGVTQRDKKGVSVELGGSTVSNLSDALVAFGLVPGAANLIETTYRVFGDVAVQQYPNIISSYPSPKEAIDLSYMKDLQKRAAPSASEINRSSVAITPAPSSRTSNGGQVSRKNYNIPFATGSATFTNTAYGQLERLRNDLLVASGTTIEVHGHTDNVGNPKANRDLSEARAFAVQRWLEKAFPRNFPAGRVRVFAHGDTMPLAPNATADGRARNRRVEIVLTSTR